MGQRFREGQTCASGYWGAGVSGSRMASCTGGSSGGAVVKEREGRMVAAAGGYMEEMWEAHMLRN